MKPCAVMLAAVLMCSCTASPSVVEPRVAYWQAKVDSELPVGTAHSAVFDWGVRNGGAFRDSRLAVTASRTLFAWLEHIELTPPPCSGWSIGVEVTLDENDRAVSTRIRSEGSCL